MDVFLSGHDQGRSIITVTGDIDLATAGDLLDRLTTLIGSARRNFGLDLSDVTFIDCAGLRTLTAVSTHVRANGASLRLTAMSPAVVRLLELVDAVRDTTLPAVAPTPAAVRPAHIAARRPPVPGPRSPSGRPLPSSQAHRPSSIQTRPHRHPGLQAPRRRTSWWPSNGDRNQVRNPTRREGHWKQCPGSGLPRRDTAGTLLPRVALQ
jgi:anti-sigma B factor antagonist